MGVHLLFFLLCLITEPRGWIHGAEGRDRRGSVCSVRDRRVLSKDVGMGDATPEVINIKMCAGDCPVHYGSFQNHYDRTLYLHHKRKGMHIPDESWKPACQITSMESINLFFNKTVGNETFFEEKEIKNMVVKSCGCRVHSCIAD